MSINREKYPGRVYPDPTDGRVRVAYTTSAFDRKTALEGLVGAVKIAYASGAREIRIASPNIRPFIRSANDNGRDGVNNPALKEWINEFSSKPLDREQGFASAHQMGSCRMGRSSWRSVVDPNCQVWGTKGLYVMDASVFPSASGVNPMVTNMAIADWASRNVASSVQTAKL